MASVSCLALAILTFTSILMLINCEQISSQDIFDSIEPKSGLSTNKRPFFVGSRYGRSEYTPKVERQVNVVPRNDRFFLGSRYGKRSLELYPEVYEQTDMDSYENTGDTNLGCKYTGITNLYRCNKRQQMGSKITASGESAK